MTRNYLDILAETIRNNWDQPALTDFYLTEDERLFVWNGEEFEEGSRNYDDYYGEEGE